MHGSRPVSPSFETRRSFVVRNRKRKIEMKNFVPQQRDHIIADAAAEASRYLSEQEIPHCLVGRIAALAQGYNCLMPTDVVFVVDADAAFKSAGRGIVATKASLPLAVNNTKVRWCSFEKPWEREAWASELALSKGDEIPVAKVSLLLYTLMIQDDVLALQAAVADGAPFAEVMEILGKHDSDLEDELAELVDDHVPGGARS
jgi:hypothetical protein